MTYSGPLWIGNLHEVSFLKKILNINENVDYNNKKRINKKLKFALEEVNMPLSYYNIHNLSKVLKLSYIPKMDEILSVFKEKGYNATRTHFDYLSIKTDLNLESIKNLSKTSCSAFRSVIISSMGQL